MTGPVLIDVTGTTLATNDNRFGRGVFKSVCLGAIAWPRIPTASDFPVFFPSPCRGAGRQSPRPRVLGMSLIPVILSGLILPRHLSLTLIAAAPVPSMPLQRGLFSSTTHPGATLLLPGPYFFLFPLSRF